MSKESIKRYTTLPFLLDILYNKRITLLDPSNWEDKNDSFYLEMYKEKKGLKSVLALCFAYAHETYQHWKIYADGSSGVCIEFDEDKLIERFEYEGIRFRSVRYELIDFLTEHVPSIDELPFIKRHAFRDEREVRAVYQDDEKELRFLDVPISLTDIKRIVVNPWVPRSVFVSMRSVVRKIDGCQKMIVRKSTVVDNEKWKAIGSNAVGLPEL